VDGSLATSSAITMAVPRRNPYGLAVIRPTRSGISQSSLPSCDSMISWTGSGRPTGGAQSPNDDRDTFCRSSRPIR
jgi:hypothetical protein